MLTVKSKNSVRSLVFDLNDTGYLIFNYEPGNGTRYEIFMVSHPYSDNNFYFGISNMGVSYKFDLNHPVMPSYVNEKFTKLTQGDAIEIADLLNEFFNELAGRWSEN